MVKLAVKSLITRLMYAGNNFACPICGYRARKFLPAGLYVKRLNEKCPSCGSLTRHRHVWFFLKDHLQRYAHSRVLHFAPEKPIEDWLRAKDGIEYRTSQYDRSVKADFHFDIQSIELEADQYDLIVCSHVLEHIPDDRKAMREMHRILKPGGFAIILVPLWPSEQHSTYENNAIVDYRDRVIHFGQFDHLRIYGLDVQQRLREAGFEVEVVDMEKRVEPDIADRYRLKNTSGIRELIFLAGK